MSVVSGLVRHNFSKTLDGHVVSVFIGFKSSVLTPSYIITWLIHLKIRSVSHLATFDRYKIFEFLLDCITAMAAFVRYVWRRIAPHIQLIYICIHIVTMNPRN